MPIVYVIARTTNHGRDLVFRLLTDLHQHTPWQTLPGEGKYITANPHLVYNKAIKSLLGLNHQQCHIAVFTMASGDDQWFEEEAKRMAEAKHLTETQRYQLRQVVKSLLQLWDDSTIAEGSLAADIDTSSELLHRLGSVLSSKEDVDKLTDAELIEAFDLDEYTPRE